MKRRCIPKLLVCLLCLAVLTGLALPALAAGDYSLTVDFRHEERPIPNASFSVYRAAVALPDGSYALTGVFEGYPISLESSDGWEWNALAATLAAYAARDSLKPDATGTTNESGLVKFSGLPEGLYLVTGEPVTIGDTTYVPQPFVVLLPSADSDGKLLTDVVAEPKYELWDRERPDTVERRVLKIWHDDGNEAKRPQNITVQLLKDGEVFDEVVLNAANNWRYRWEGLDADAVWQIVEKDLPDDYTVLIDQQGVTFTITNTCPPPPEESTQPTETTKPGRLPQTGVLWWPVPVLLAVGLICLVVGVILRKRKQKPNA